MRCLSFYGLALLLLLLMVAQVALAQIVYPRENTCRTPNGRTGECINLKRCPELLRLLQKKPLPDSAVKYLQQSQCGFEGMDPTVCCAKSGNPSNPPTQPPATDDSQPPDVTNHPNLRLLDHQKCGPINVDQKIVGGDVAGLFEFPWMALLAYDVGKPKLEFRCGGSIINNRYILTAAHCVTNLPSNLRLAGIRVGEWDTSTEVDCQDRGTDEEICSERYQDFGIESFHFHELYSKRNYQNDIALIRVNAPIDFRPLNTRPICMPIGPAAEIKSTKLKASGWGLTEDLVTSSVLLKVNLPIYPMDQCAEMLKREVPIWRKQICMGGAKGKDSCRGDSGGPLQGPTVYQGSSRYVQYGVVSLGMKMCGTQNFPGVYTRVAYYLDWILNTMRD